MRFWNPPDDHGVRRSRFPRDHQEGARGAQSREKEFLGNMIEGVVNVYESASVAQGFACQPARQRGRRDLSKECSRPQIAIRPHPRQAFNEIC